MPKDTIFTLIGLGVICSPLLVIPFAFMKTKNYMDEQKNFNSDKVLLLNSMQAVMKEQYGDFSYVLGYYFKSRYESHQYILSFRPGDIIVMPYGMDGDRIIIKNSFSAEILGYKVKPKEVILFTREGKRKIKITLPKIAESSGDRRSAFPLAVFQEKEVENFINLLYSMNK
ncbi:MAG: hypothetical protein K2P76_07515 [Lachnospiraceae bacterium]|nr:hypothetical protein [Lachnospiraceae bacterium]MDE6982652.1 hypothetical protein [Lachnospiraceae bacterium]